MNIYIISTEFKNIYITSDEEIKDDDWTLKFPFGNEVFKNIKVVFNEYIKRAECPKSSVVRFTYPYDWCKKIILTTDPQLIEDGIQAIDNEFLKWFDTNPSCESVEIKSETLWLNKRFGGTWQPFPDEEATERKKNYKIIIPKGETKPHSFCETPEEKCTMNYCDENGCQNRKRTISFNLSSSSFLRELEEPTKEQKVLTRRERLKDWISTLNEEQKNTIILELTDYAIDSEYVSFYERTKVPYYANSGENVDGLSKI